MLIKTAGSVKAWQSLKMMVEAGTDIIDTNSGVEIVNKAKGKENVFQYLIGSDDGENQRQSQS